MLMILYYISESAEDLQKVLHNLKGFLDKWILIINTSKTRIAML